MVERNLINLVIVISGLQTGCGKKGKLCAFLEANCAGQKVNSAGYCAGLHNLASDKIFCIPTPYLSAHIVKIFIFLSDSMYHPMNFTKEKFDLEKMQSFLEVLKTFKFAAILVHHSHQSSLGFE